MAAPANQRTEAITPKVYVIPKGETVSGTPVTSSAWPLSTGNLWDPYLITKIKTVVPEHTYERETLRYARRNFPGFQNVPDVQLVDRKYNVTTFDNNSYIRQLMAGLAAAPSAVTAVALAAEPRGQFEAAVMIRLTNKDGTLIEEEKFWAFCSVTSMPAMDGKTREYVLQLWADIDNVLNTFAPLA